MKKRKGSLLQRMMAVLLSAVLVVGMLSSAAPVTVLAQEPDGQQEDTDGSGMEPAAGDTKPEEKTETAPAEGTGSGEQEKPAPEGQEKPGTTEGGGETEKGDDLTGHEPGGGMEEKPQEPGGGTEQETPGTGTEEGTEPGTVSGNDAAPEAAAKPQSVMRAAAPAPQADNIASGEGWVLDADGRLTITSDNGMTGWIASRDTIHNGTPYRRLVTSAEITGVTGIRKDAFLGCSDLTGSITLPEGVTSIGENAFRNCPKLTGITIPGNVTDIGKAAFASCAGLTGITIPGSVTSIGESAFAACEGLTSITIPDTVTSMGNEMFRGCGGLTSVSLPNNMASIGNYMFCDCHSLTSVTIPQDVTAIGERAFYRCEGLQEITVPGTVMQIARFAFGECASLESITFLSDTPPTLGGYVFGCDYSFGGTDESGKDERCGFVKGGRQGIHVPDGKAQAYKDAWADWAAYIADDTPTPPAEEHKHNDVTFNAWTKTDSLPKDPGNYYLTENVTLSATWNVPSGTTSLCLNGKTISASGTDTYRVITIPESCTLNLYDCQNAGNITGGKSGGVWNGGTFCMYGGKISGNNAAYGSGGVYNGGTFYMYGGEISGNTAEGGVGGVETYRKFYMYGGKIRNNKRNSDGELGGGGVCINAVGSFTVGGSAVISENTCNGKEDNVYLNNSFGNRQLITIDSSNPLSNSANIGVTSLPAPTDASPVNITGENGADYSQYFQSDNPDYEIVNGENNVVQLAVKHTHEADMAWQQDADGHWHSCKKNGCGEKLDYAVHTFEGNKCNVCGYIKTSTETHEHNDVTFDAWTKTDSLPTDAGNYYLTEDVVLLGTWNVPEGTISLCLNGKTIRASNNFGEITIPASCTLNLYGCKNAGTISFSSTRSVQNEGTFNMYGGKLSGSVYNDGTFYMYDGKISLKVQAPNGGVVNKGSFLMYGGEISGNRTSSKGGGVNAGSGTFTVGGSAVIAGNNPDNVWIGVDSLIEIDEENPLSGSAKIGITTQTTPTAGNPVNITGENDADYSQYFQSDNPDYEIINGENNVVQLAVKHTHNLTRVDAKTATCTEDGNTAYYTCDGCDKWFSDESGTQEITDKTSVVIPAAGHVFDDTEWGYKAADGHAHSCKNCDAHDEIQEHTPGEAATESTPQTCTECGYIMNPAIGHTCNPRLVEKKEPDCTTAGKEAYYHCEGCGKYYEDEAGTTLIADISAWGNIAAPGHDWGEWTVTKPATATTPGEKERTCKRCNEKETETIPKTGGGNKPGGGSGSGGNSGGGTSGGSDDNSGGNSGDNGGNNGGNQGSGSAAGGNQDSSGNGNAGGSTGNSGGSGAGTSGKPGAPGAGQPKVKQEKEGNIRKEVRVEGADTLDAAVETPLSELADIVLTKEEKQKAAGGTDVKIVLDVKDASAVVSAADKALVEKALNGSQAKGYTLGQYLDISLYKVVGNSRNIITETNRKITVTIDVPDSLKNADSTMTRTFAVIRVHEGKTEFLPDLDHNDNTITIKTDRFSTYAVVYKDMAGGNGSVVRVSVEDGSKKSGGAKDSEPKTGDAAPLELYATLAMIAGFAYLLLYFADRERGMTEETKKALVSRLVGWAKQGGRIRKYLALAAIFVLLVYYHSIGKKMCVRWKAIYGE